MTQQRRDAFLTIKDNIKLINEEFNLINRSNDDIWDNQTFISSFEQKVKDIINSLDHLRFDENITPQEDYTKLICN